MAKRLLLDVLVKVLGEFIELNEDNLDLSLAVWSGHIALKDLKLKTHKLLRNFDLSILHGEIKTLDVTIPWTALLNSPVKVIIDGVNLQVGPLNVAALDKEDTKKRVISAKMQKLRMVDRFIDFSSGGTTSEIDVEESSNSDSSAEKEKKMQSPTPNARATYVQQWTSKIIDNIEITLKNVHIRYEDSQTIPGSPFSAGITLNSFTLSTCDDKWHEKFVARDINKPTSSIRKMAKVYNFGLYWMTKSTILSGETFKDWSSKMQGLIYPGLGTSEKSHFSDIQYILHPANNLVVRLIHNERTMENVPKFDMIVESTNLPLSIDRVQYLQLLRTLEMIGVTERRRQPHMYRPYERPSNPENARAWWKYACKMIVKRGRYIRLVKLSKTLSEDSGLIDIRSDDEKRESRELEERMPLRSLVIFRHAAAREMHSDARKRYLQLEREAIAKGQRMPSGKGVQRTWMGWVAGLETAAEDQSTEDTSNVFNRSKSADNAHGDTDRDAELDGDVSIASIISSLEREGDEATNATVSAALFRLSLTTSASLDVAVGGLPVASATMALTILAEVTTWGVCATVHMRDLLVVDRCTVTPAIRNIIAVKQSSTPASSDALDHDPPGSHRTSLKKEDSSPDFSVIFESLNNRTVIRISALPLEIAVNKVCVQQLIGLFLAPTSSSSRMTPARADPKKFKQSFEPVQEPVSFKKVTKPEGSKILEKKPSQFYIEGLQTESEGVDFKFRIIDEKVEEKEEESLDQGPPNEAETGTGTVGAKFQHTGHEGDLEIIFEAQAPNIIIPQDSSSDGGYLLLDTGYLAVRGFIGPTGMSWDVSLKDVNAGMPRTVQDMYGFKEQSLYLIKPFDITVFVQTTDTGAADMTVDVSVQPEVRGELDSSKLARLLQVLPVITSTFARANCLASVSLADRAILPTPPLSRSPSMADLIHLSEKEFSVPRKSSLGGTGTLDGDEPLSFGTPPQSPPPIKTRKSISLKREVVEEDPNLTLPDMVGAIIADSVSGGQLEGDELLPVEDPTHISMAINLRIPEVALDLTYDVSKGRHLVLALRTLEMRILFRPNDMQIYFDLSELSIQDSLRSDAQQDLARTPRGEKSLIHISYVCMYSALSPLYRKHATEVVVEFATLGLNFDVNTITHLRPFMEVLLARKPAPPPTPEPISPHPQNTQKWNQSTNSLNSLAIGVEESTPDAGCGLKGMHVLVTVSNISLDLLRTPTLDTDGAVLASAFSLQITDLRADIDIIDLVKADVKLRSFDIIDERAVSTDYVFKKVFCPVVDMDASMAQWRRSVSATTDMDSGVSKKRDGNSSKEEKEKYLNVPKEGGRPPDLLHVTYAQISTNISAVNVTVLNVTSFVSIDTILDLSYAAMANAFAILDLIAAPPMPLSESPPPLSDLNPDPNWPCVDDWMEEDDALDLDSQLSPQQLKMASSDSRVTPFPSADTASPLRVRPASLSPALATYACDQCSTPIKPVPSPINTQPDGSSTTMNVIVKVTNPRLILLEDPTTEESRAIVGSCDIEVHYSRENRMLFGVSSVTNLQNRELRESLHVSVHNHEVFVLRSMLQWHPQPIVEPMGMELHLRRRTLNTVLVSSIISVDMDNVNARVSINDIFLAQSIMTRRSLTEPPTLVPSSPIPILPPTPAIPGGSGGRNRRQSSTSECLTQDPGQSPLEDSGPSPSYTYSLNMGSFSLVGINDFNGQNVPVIRALLDGTTFYAEGKQHKMHGEGSLIASTDFYNPKLSVWEPILDRWHPSLSLTSWVLGTSVEIKSEHTMQLTVSGTMLEVLLQTYSLFFRLDDVAEREEVPDVLINNALGSNIDLQIFYSATRVAMMTLKGQEAKAVPRILGGKGRNGRSLYSLHNTPTVVDVHFLGDFGQQRLPLRHVPFNINKPRVYNLQPRPLEQPLGGSDKGTDPGSAFQMTVYTQPVVLEPLVEEVFESSRYDPITGRWRQPFLLGDPFEWTDASGTVSKEIQSIQLHSDKWEWLGQWAVDMDADVGDEVDRDGWEYGTSFASFSIASRRRGSHAMDCVRRRRWLRTRVPTAGSVDERFRPLSIFWDVQVLQSGTRRVDVRSGLKVRNVMPFAIKISLTGSAWEGTQEFGPVEEDQCFNIPLMQASASFIKIRPAALPYGWSQAVSCCMQIHDFTSMRDVHCEGLDTGVGGGHGDGEDLSPVCMRVVCAQTSKSLEVTVLPFVTIANRLPCDLQYTCNSSDKKRDEGSLLSGATCKLTNISLSFLPKISFRLGDNRWSVPRTIDPLMSDPIKVEVLGPTGVLMVVLTMLVKTSGTTGAVEVCVCSKGMLIDRTGGLGVSIWARRGRVRGEEITRSTFRSALDSTGASIGATAADVTLRSSVSSADKIRRRAAVRAAGKLGGLNSRASTLLLAGQSSPSSKEDFSSDTPTRTDRSATPSVIRLKTGSADTDIVSADFSDTRLGTSSASPFFSPSKLRHFSVDDVEKNRVAQHEYGVSDSDEESADFDDGLSEFSADEDKQGSESGQRRPSLKLRDFSAQSSRAYEVVRVDVGEKVYSDRAIRWTHLPSQLRKQLCIRTPCDDKLTRSKSLIHFTVSSASLVLLLVDMRAAKSPPKWIKDDGFRRIREQAIARMVHLGVLQETFYGVFGKYFGRGEYVLLKGNWSKDALSMYSVFVVPTPSDEDLGGPGTGTGTGPPVPQSDSLGCVENAERGEQLGVVCARGHHQDIRRMFEEVTFDQTYKRSNAGSSWIEGGNGLSMFYSEDDAVSIGVKGAVWSEEFSINMLTSPHRGSFEAVDWETMRAYQLSYSMSYMPGLFSGTQLLTITPRYCIVNCLETPIMVVQRGSKEILEIAPYQAEGWHKSRASLGTSVQLRSASSLWSLGTVDLNEVGRSVIHLPRKGSTPMDPPFVVLVEVKVAELTDHCSVVVVIWRACVDTSTALAIRNDSDVHVTVKQADIDFEHMGLETSLFEVCVGPSQCLPFGWADPDAGSDILVTAGSSMIGAKLRIARLNFLRAGEQLRLPDNSGRIGFQGEVVLSVLAEGGGRVLRITRSSDIPAHSSKSFTDSSSTDGLPRSVSPGAVRSFGLSFSFASFGLSLAVEKPIRREFLSLYIDGLEGRVKTKGQLRSFEFMIMDLQVDNYSETVVYPVLLHSTKKEVHKSVDLFQRNEPDPDGEDDGLSSFKDGLNSALPHEVPLLQMTLIEELPCTAASSSILKYVVIRVLPLALEVESATLQLLFSDLISDLKFVDRDQTLASCAPDKWIDDFNMKLMSPDDGNTVDVYRSQVAAQASKMYIEKLVIHPMKLTLTFVQTPFPRKRGKDTFQATALNMLTSLAGVDRMQLRLKSFEVDDVLESRASLIDLILHKTMQDLQSQLAQIAGSLTVIGSPMGFARKVGSGVKSFFYEPYQGAVLGPQDFVVGLGRGTTHLLANVVSGAMNSTVAIVGTASKGISFLSGDAEYVRKRALKRQRNRANRGGIMDGILDGSESVISGITSGMSGLVTKPFEEARKSGVTGFFRGVGLGLIGAAVKPVMGITDGLTSVASGVSNQVGVASVHVLVRPARALERSANDASDLVLVPLNLDAAFAQEFIIRRAKSNGYEDSFLSYVPMESSGEAMILSETYVYWRKPKSLWGRTWANISHCYFSSDSVGIVLYGGETEAVLIPCNSRTCAVRVYTALSHNSHRMGFPSKIIPVDLATQDRGTALSSTGKDDYQDRQKRAVSLAGDLEGYLFGAANDMELRKIVGPENDVLKRVQGRMLGGYASWAQLDESVWRLVWEWDCTHTGLQASRCCATVIINRSLSPLQIARVQIVHGKNVLFLGSVATGYEAESRAIMPGGSAVVFVWAFSPSPIEIGHLKACISSAAFSATVASTQRESSCEARGGFTVGFLEKSVSAWWSKYVLLVT